MRKFGRLREKIKVVFGTQKEFAKAMGMSITSLNGKLNSKAQWTLAEIEKACMLLDISKIDTTEYFFY